MTDFDTSDPPRYRFGLFGHRASGKTVYLVALGAARRPEIDGFDAQFQRGLPPEAGSDAVAVSSAEDVERDYAAALEALREGKLPDQTDSTAGNLRYAFSLSGPTDTVASDQAANRRELEISDHAGELVNRLTNEDDKAAILRSFLSERDGLILVAEAPHASDTPEARTRALTEVRALSSRLAQVMENLPVDRLRCRAAVLLVTKWDHIHPFDGFQRQNETAEQFRERLSQEEARHAVLFEQWLETPEASEHLHLLSELRNRFGRDAVQAYPVTAFGEAVQRQQSEGGEWVELPARIPLPSLNLVKPLRFLADRTDRILRDTLMERCAQDSPGGGLHFWRLLDRRQSGRLSLPAWRDVRPRFGDDPELKKALEGVHSRRKHARTEQILTGSGVMALAFCLVGGGIGAIVATDQKAMANTALANPALPALIAADDRLLKRASSTKPWPWVLSQRWLFPDLEVEALRVDLKAAECRQWEVAVDIRSGTPNQQKIAEFRERTADAPRCEGLAQEISQHESKLKFAAIMDRIDRLLDSNDFNSAIHEIFSAARSPETPPEIMPDLRQRLDGLDGRVEKWIEQKRTRKDGAKDIKRQLDQISSTLESPPSDMDEAARRIEEKIQRRLKTNDLHIACDDYAQFLDRAEAFAVAVNGWPRLDDIRVEIDKIHRWEHRDSSEFKDAASWLNSHLKGLQRMQIREVKISGDLRGARGVKEAVLEVRLQDSLRQTEVDTRAKKVLARVDIPQAVILEAAPRISVSLTEKGLFWGETNWVGSIGSGIVNSWDDLRDKDWSVTIRLVDQDPPNTSSDLTVTIIPAKPMPPPDNAALPKACMP